MKILFIAPYIPSRIRVRPFHFIKELAKEHEVHVVALGEGHSKKKMSGADEMVEIVRDFRMVGHPKLRGYVQSLLSLPTATPMCAAFCRSTRMSRVVDEMVARESFDVIHVEHIRAAHFAPLDAGVPVVFDGVDCLAGLFRQMSRRGQNPLGKLVAMEEAWKLSRYEPRMLGRFDRTVITSDAERDSLLSFDDRLEIEVVPNGVDTDYFQPCGARKSPRRIVFSGKMGYAPNAEAALWFAEHVFPRLRLLWDDAEFIILGNDPPPRIKALAERDGITVTGYVDDLRPYLDSASIAVAPMRVAVGVQNKVLEAMAMGLAVVVSPLAGRTVEESGSLLIADHPDEWFVEVSRLMESPDEAARLGASNRAYVIARHSWATSARMLVGIYNDAMSGRAR